MVSGGFVTVIVVLAVAGCGGLPESVTWNVSSMGGVIPVGVPLTIPVAEFNVKPVGSVPEVNCQTYGVVPPFAVSENVQSRPVKQLTGKGFAAVSRVAMVSGRGFVSLCIGVLASVTWNVGVAVPAVVGVPLTTPVTEFNVKPNGSVPEVTCHVRAPVPPVAVSVCEYGTPTMPSLSAVVVIFSSGFVTVIVVLAVALCGGLPESVTWNVSGVAATAVVGVPLTTPVEAFNVKPAGSGPTVNCQA
jgi:hypothetical protein